jgi:hypothetical protein
MPYAIELFFDTQSEKEIMSLGYFQPNTFPHISLGVYNHLDIEKAIHFLETFKKELKIFEIVFPFLGTFLTPENVIFLGTSKNETLNKIHRLFFEKSKKILPDIWDNYSPTYWQPHCTLDIGNPDPIFFEHFQKIKHKTKIFKVTVHSIGIIEFPIIKKVIELEFDS